MKKLIIQSLISLTIFASVSVFAQTQSTAPIAKQIEDLKKEIIALNRDLFILEEDLLFPSSTQLAVYLSIDVGTYFQLDSVELKIGDKTVTHYLYTQKQIDALHRGGVQKLYIGNIAQGEHEISAFFHGLGPEKRPYKRGVVLSVDKDEDPKAIELQIRDSNLKLQPKFEAVEL
ncbi:hypothetical protein [Paraglaciecola sp. L3A3]|uniref:hypothetical protein n=1 Tax=Paraglaciecola sp. L3A3 TaxID=2686358 RepID=UPI0018EF1E4F|nr:hypothetical protein [Paraglaciecola sp. L3A3]